MVRTENTIQIITDAVSLLGSGFLQVSNQVPPVFLLPQSCIHHLSPWDVLLRVLQVDIQGVLPPGDPLVLVGPGVAVPLRLPSLSPYQPIQV